MNEPELKGSTRRLVHFTPLRYPGGKGKLAGFIKKLIEINRISDGNYIEPYAGGAAIALELLLQEYVSRVWINDVNLPIWSFWKCVLDHTEDLCKLIADTPCTVESWDAQKRIFSEESRHGVLALGFATFFLNRTNRSGILNGGIIGGRHQLGKWKIDARYNPHELIFRIRSIAKMRSRIELSRKDALEFLRWGADQWHDRTLIYLDPPYYTKGRQLYYDYYTPGDHGQVAKFLTQNRRSHRWIVSYDDVQPIRELYSQFKHRTYSIGYSARSVRRGAEVMFFCDSLSIPEWPETIG